VVGDAVTDIVVLLPGITGSVLQKDGKDIWAMSPGAALRALVSFGQSITDLELTEADGDDGVTAPRLISDLHLIPGLWKIDGYGKVSRFIQDSLHAVRDQTFFEFPYDWRRDNRVAARQLKDASDIWLHERRKEYPDAKLILVGHSMGGLVARYFLECLEGWRDTRMLVTFGTPFRGSVNAIGFLVHGMRKGLGPITLIDLSTLLRSFTSIYQLLPIYPCVQDEADGELVRVSEAASIPHVDAQRARDAEAFHREIEYAVTTHRDDAEYREHGYAIHPIVGTFQPTNQSVVRSGETIQTLRSFRGEDRDGDSTVPRDSATPIEFEHEEGAMFAAERHASLQNLDAALVQLSGVVTGRDTSSFRAFTDRLGLDIEDLYPAEEPVTIRARSEAGAVQLSASVTDEHGMEVAGTDLARGFDEWLEADVGPLEPGAYRVSVEGAAGVQPVSDRFIVYRDEAP
jgi:pimeloyl-ACP methyl ester carboxylesterase